MAALTRGREGREMAEIGFLQDAGAVAFTDCDAVVTNTTVLLCTMSVLTFLIGLVSEQIALMRFERLNK